MGWFSNIVSSIRSRISGEPSTPTPTTTTTTTTKPTTVATRTVITSTGLPTLTSGILPLEPTSQYPKSQGISGGGASSVQEVSMIAQQMAETGTPTNIVARLPGEPKTPESIDVTRLKPIPEEEIVAKKIQKTTVPVPLARTYLIEKDYPKSFATTQIPERERVITEVSMPQRATMGGEIPKMVLEQPYSMWKQEKEIEQGMIILGTGLAFTGIGMTVAGISPAFAKGVSLAKVGLSGAYGYGVTKGLYERRYYPPEEKAKFMSDVITSSVGFMAGASIGTQIFKPIPPSEITIRKPLAYEKETEWRSKTYGKTREYLYTEEIKTEKIPIIEEGRVPFKYITEKKFVIKKASVLVGEKGWGITTPEYQEFWTDLTLKTGVPELRTSTMTYLRPRESGLGITLREEISKPRIFEHELKIFKPSEIKYYEPGEFLVVSGGKPSTTGTTGLITSQKLMPEISKPSVLVIPKEVASFPGYSPVSKPSAWNPYGLVPASLIEIGYESIQAPTVAKKRTFVSPGIITATGTSTILKSMTSEMKKTSASISQSSLRQEKERLPPSITFTMSGIQRMVTGSTREAFISQKTDIGQIPRLTFIQSPITTQIREPVIEQGLRMVPPSRLTFPGITPTTPTTITGFTFGFPFLLPKISGGFGGGGFNIGKRFGSMKFYQPSLTGILTGFTIPKAPTGTLTGLEIRPMVRKRRRKR